MNKVMQSYLDNIQAKTGKTVADFRALAKAKGISKETSKHGEVIAWLKSDFDLGHGHANLIAQLVLNPDTHNTSADDKLAKLFAGGKAPWRNAYDALTQQLETLGDDFKVAPTSSYISLLRGAKKFAIVQPSAARLDIGIKLKSADATERLEPAGSWNNMVTHRVRIHDPQQIDTELIAWLKQAFVAA